MNDVVVKKRVQAKASNFSTSELVSAIRDSFVYEEGGFIRRKGRNSHGRVVGSANSMCIKNSIYGHAGFFCNGIYIRMSTHRIIYALHNGVIPHIVDHIDKDPSNNNINNLREATNIINARNSSRVCRKSMEGLSDIVSGVLWERGRYSVRIHKKRYGVYDDFDVAVFARLVAELNECWHNENINSQSFCRISASSYSRDELSNLLEMCYSSSQFRTVLKGISPKDILYNVEKVLRKEYPQNIFVTAIAEYNTHTAKNDRVSIMSRQIPNIPTMIEVEVDVPFYDSEGNLLSVTKFVRQVRKPIPVGQHVCR